MYGLLSGGARGPAVRPAHSVLTTLMESVGTAGLAAAADRPGLLAEIDQHAAAVRDSLTAAGSAVHEAALAGYAEGVREAAGSHGWQPPTADGYIGSTATFSAATFSAANFSTADGSTVDWSAPDWVLARLVAVCALASAEAARHRAAWAASPFNGGPADGVTSPTAGTRSVLAGAARPRAGRAAGLRASGALGSSLATTGSRHRR
jgi:hypothetical protein